MGILCAVNERCVMGRRERKKLATRRLIRENALRLFATQGFEETTINDITEAADVAPRTFFLHYHSKEDVLLADSQQRLEMFEEALAQQPNDRTPLQAVHGALVHIAEHTPIDRDEMLLRTRLMEQAPSVKAEALKDYAAFERIIVDDVVTRTGQTPAESPFALLLAAASMAAMRIAITMWCQQEDSESVRAFLDRTFEQLAAGLDEPLVPQAVRSEATLAAPTS